MVPSTFASIHEGPTTTWTHSTGKKSRKDYILLSQDVAKLASKSWVEVHHDSTFAHEDHLPVVLQCAGWLPTSSTHPTIGWDDRAMLDPAQVDAFQRALRTLPLPAWDIGIDDHAALYEQQLLALGRQFFARKPPAKNALSPSAPRHWKPLHSKGMCWISAVKPTVCTLKTSRWNCAASKRLSLV